jgi:hypothetical protein
MVAAPECENHGVAALVFADILSVMLPGRLKGAALKRNA